MISDLKQQQQHWKIMPVCDLDIAIYKEPGTPINVYPPDF